MHAKLEAAPAGSKLNPLKSKSQFDGTDKENTRDSFINEGDSFCCVIIAPVLLHFCSLLVAHTTKYYNNISQKEHHH